MASKHHRDSEKWDLILAGTAWWLEHLGCLHDLRGFWKGCNGIEQHKESSSYRQRMTWEAYGTLGLDARGRTSTRKCLWSMFFSNDTAWHHLQFLHHCTALCSLFLIYGLLLCFENCWWCQPFCVTGVYLVSQKPPSQTNLTPLCTALLLASQNNSLVSTTAIPNFENDC